MMTEQSTLTRAEDFLGDATRQLTRNASRRDQPNGERSIPRAVAAFNALEGTALTVAQGARMLACIKLARATGGGEFNPDDYVDGAAYLALAGEAEAQAHRAQTPVEPCGLLTGLVTDIHAIQRAIDDAEYSYARLLCMQALAATGGVK